jgi:uncharacterized membrane protein
MNDFAQGFFKGIGDITLFPQLPDSKPETTPWQGVLDAFAAANRNLTEAIYEFKKTQGLPPASELEQLKAVDPSFPERIMRIAESHAAADIRQKDRFSMTPIIGQIASVLISCFGFGISILFAFKGIETGVIAAIIGGISPIIIAALVNLKKK